MVSPRDPVYSNDPFHKQPRMSWELLGELSTVSWIGICRWIDATFDWPAQHPLANIPRRLASSALTPSGGTASVSWRHKFHIVKDVPPVP